MTRGGRPLSEKSLAVVAAMREASAPMTYTQVAQRLQLGQRDALVICDRLAASGHLVVVGTAPAQGRRPPSLYAAPVSTLCILDEWPR